MNNMSKYLVPAGVVWVAFALILGLVLTLQPLVKMIGALSHSSSSESVKYVQTTIIKDGTADTGKVKTSVGIGLPPSKGDQKIPTSATISK